MKKSDQPSPWYLGFEEYEKVSEPHKKEKSFAWTTAIGLQAVDGLTPSKYLLETARRHIEGEITIQEANKIIDDYYQTEKEREQDKDDRTEEADKVSARIAEILNDGAFSLRPLSLKNIHKQLFKGIYKFAGKIRDYNITKKEWVLDGDTVYYMNFPEIETALKYDFEQEKEFPYNEISGDDFIKHFAKFISSIWQVHAFGDAQVAEGDDLNNFHSCKRREATYGNTRTTAVFAIKYLRYLGYGVNNQPFVDNSGYFRNALVRANYSSPSKNVKSDSSFLEMFFRNLLLGEKNELKNRYLHIYWDGANGKDDKEKTAQKILEILKENPQATVSELQEILGKGNGTIKEHIAKLKKQGLLKRIGPDNGGHWEVRGE